MNEGTNGRTKAALLFGLVAFAVVKYHGCLFVTIQSQVGDKIFKLAKTVGQDNAQLFEGLLKLIAALGLQYEQT